MNYKVTYSNQGKRESTPILASKEKAEKTVEFLKFQGAKRVRFLETFEPTLEELRRFEDED